MILEGRGCRPGFLVTLCPQRGQGARGWLGLLRADRSSISQADGRGSGPPSAAGERWAGGMERALGVRGARAGSRGLQTCQRWVRPDYIRDV